MNINVKYEKGERVLFLLFDSKHIGKFDFCSGEISKISITLTGHTYIKYNLVNVRIYKGDKIGILKGDYNNLDEEVLFKNEKDLFNHFQRNIRTFLDKDHQTFIKNEQNDYDEEEDYMVDEDVDEDQEGIYSYNSNWQDLLRVLTK